MQEGQARGATAHDLSRRGQSSIVPWLFDEQAHPRSGNRLPEAHTLIEMFCAGSVGRTLGYEYDGHHALPVLAAQRNQPVLDWGLERVQQTAVRVAEIAAPLLSEEELRLDTRDVVLSLLRAFWVHPTPSEATAWGSFPWEEETNTPFSPLAQRLTTRDVLARLMRGERQIRRVNSWRAGSAIVSNEPWRSVIRARAWQLANRERLARLPRRVRIELASRRT